MKTFYITYYSQKDKQTITRRGKHDDKTRLGVSKKNVPYFVYFDIDKNDYRGATGNWKVRY